MDAVALEPKVLDRIFHSLSPEDRVEILSIGAAFRRLNLEKQLARAQSKAQEFEARYHCYRPHCLNGGWPD